MISSLHFSNLVSLHMLISCVCFSIIVIRTALHMFNVPFRLYILWEAWYTNEACILSLDHKVVDSNCLSLFLKKSFLSVSGSFLLHLSGSTEKIFPISLLILAFCWYSLSQVGGGWWSPY